MGKSTAGNQILPMSYHFRVAMTHHTIFITLNINDYLRDFGLEIFNKKINAVAMEITEKIFLIHCFWTCRRISPILNLFIFISTFSLLGYGERCSGRWFDGIFRK